MSYYGPASRDNDQRVMRRQLPQYDYNQYREHNQELLYRAEHFNRHNKRLRRTFRIVPWRDERELQAVGKALLSVLEPQNDPVNQDMFPEEAFATISVWKSRLEGLPHAIESTAALAQVYWRDSQRRAQRLKGLSSRNDVGVSVAELRLAYSAAIVRCINGFADILQQQRAMAASVSNLCGQLGIPSWVVDTRHEGSHNALPNLEVLRLSASTLLEFIRSEYWVPRCADWNNCNNELDKRITMLGEDETSNVEKDNLDSQNRSLIDFLLEYEACASDWIKTRGIGTTNDSEAESDKTTGKRQKKPSSGPKTTTILPYDPLFGEVGTLGCSSDDDDTSDTADHNRNGAIKLDKPVVNSIWGSSVGTNTNRYILLDIPTKKKKKGKCKCKKEQKKSIPNNVKKRKGEKSPTDCAKLFVQSVSSLQEGYAVAIQYLLWGGVGGAPIGQGVLISGSEIAFPATPHGVTKCWQLYSPLVHVISRTWPGFAANMITNLVDCVLSTEDGMMCYENETYKRIQKQDVGEGATRKLYFLSAWIRLLLSHRFVATLDQKFAGKSVSSKNNNPLVLPLAQLSHLECLGYPLSSILDRCRRFNTDIRKFNGSDGNKNSTDSDSSDPDLTETSRSIISSLETILGEKKTSNFGYPEIILPPHTIQQNISPSLSERTEEEKDGTTPIATTEATISSGTMSLDEIEKMLLLDDNDNHNEPETTTERSTNGSSDALKQPATVLPETDFIGEAEPPIRRPAWIRCERWDTCSIGSLPGHLS